MFENKWSRTEVLDPTAYINESRVRTAWACEDLLCTLWILGPMCFELHIIRCVDMSLRSWVLYWVGTQLSTLQVLELSWGIRCWRSEVKPIWEYIKFAFSWTEFELHIIRCVNMSLWIWVLHCVVWCTEFMQLTRVMVVLPHPVVLQLLQAHSVNVILGSPFLGPRTHWPGHPRRPLCQWAWLM